MVIHATEVPFTTCFCLSPVGNFALLSSSSVTGWHSKISPRASYTKILKRVCTPEPDSCLLAHAKTRWRKWTASDLFGIETPWISRVAFSVSIASWSWKPMNREIVTAAGSFSPHVTTILYSLAPCGHSPVACRNGRGNLWKWIMCEQLDLNLT